MGVHHDIWMNTPARPEYSPSSLVATLAARVQLPSSMSPALFVGLVSKHDRSQGGDQLPGGTEATVNRTALLVCVLVAIAGIGTPGHQDYIREAPAASEFPAADAMVRSSQLMGLRAAAAGLALQAAPDRAATFDLLLRSGRLTDALTVLERIVATQPGEMQAAFAAAATKARDFAADAAHDHAGRLRALVGDARRQLADLPREDAAALARELVGIESGLATGENRWRDRLISLVAEYAGTRAARLAEVDLLSDGSGQARLDALDAFVREHPGTEAAARALHAKGFDLAHNALSFGERAGSDPTERFFRVVDIYKELRSGRYPPSRWVDEALALVTGFSAYQPSYRPGNAERILAVYEEVLPLLLEAFERDRAEDSIAFVVAYRMGPLPTRQGDAVAGIDGVFDRLERLANNRHAVRLLRAEFYLRPHSPVIDEKDWPALRARARTLLESLVEQASGFERRRALATLATLRFSDGDMAQARTLYQQYLESYPDSDYAWVAALRIGECEAAVDPSRAEAAFQHAAARFSSNPIARVLGHAYAARAAEAGNEFSRALTDYEAALGAWDSRYGSRYSLFSRRPTPSSDPLLRADAGEVTRELLQARVTALKQTTVAGGGVLVERARWLVSKGRWDEAITVGEEFLSRHAASPLAGDRRYLTSRARLEKALDLADADNPDAAIGPAIARLQALTREPVDAAVAAAKLALGTILHLSASKQDAGALIAEALRDWQTLDGSAQTIGSRDGFEKDVIEVRNAVFRPDGAGVLRDGRWDVFKWSASLPFVLASPHLRVKTAGETQRVTAYDPFPHVPNTVFLDDERRILLERIITKLGGTKKRPWVRVMETPNRPDGPTLEVLGLWRKSFWVQPGHWGGWIFESFPIINEIEFVDTGRTKAAVKIRVGYTGATAQLEKQAGAWVVKKLTNFWIE